MPGYQIVDAFYVIVHNILMNVFSLFSCARQLHVHDYITNKLHILLVLTQTTAFKQTTVKILL